MPRRKLSKNDKSLFCLRTKTVYHTVRPVK